MTKVFIADSPSNMKALQDFVFQLTGKRAEKRASFIRMNGVILIEVRDDGVYLIQGRDLKEGSVPVSLPEAMTYIREQVFICSLEK